MESYGSAELIETHISCLLVTPKYTYKLKKPLDLGFLDFSTLEKRAHFCQEEVRLNGRLAPTVYLRAIPITGSPDRPVLSGEGEPIEYAVEMRSFEAGGLLSLHPELLSDGLIDSLADQLCGFHSGIDTARSDSEWGSPESIWQPMQENYTQIASLISVEPEVQLLLDSLHQWSEDQFLSLTPKLVQRKLGGFVRECHGDLHLGNITIEKSRPVIFDGLEFNPALRWIDTASELAFLLMDLDERASSEWGYKLLNRYLSLTGDYGLLPVLRFYQVYRSMVRAKVMAIRLGQLSENDSEYAHLKNRFQNYLELAMNYTRPSEAALILTFGYSGSGKSWYCKKQFDGKPIIVVRSDVERKKIGGTFCFSKQ